MDHKYPLASLATLLTVLLAGCGTAPLSFIADAPPVKLLPNYHYPVRVVAVDDTTYLHMPVQLSPGERNLLLEAFPRPGTVFTTQRNIKFTVEPCTRYEFVAVRKSPMDPNWELLVHRKEAVSACNPEEEIRKVAIASASVGGAKAR